MSISIKDFENLRDMGIMDKLFNSANIGLLFINKIGTIVYVNSKWNELLQNDDQQLKNKNVEKSLPWLDFHQILKTGHSQFHFVKQNAVVIECQAMANDSGPFGVMCLAQPRDKCMSYCKRIKDYARLNEELNDIIESSYDGIWVSDEKGYASRVNSAYERITGIKVKDVIGRRAMDLVKQGFYAASVTEPVLKAKQRMSIVNTTVTGKKILVTGNPILTKDGSIKRIVVNVRDITELVELQRELESLIQKYEAEVHEDFASDIFKDVIAHSPAMRLVLGRVRKVAAVDSTVLITGESGVGKEVVASLIHKLSIRKNGPFIKVNCGAIPQSLIESELFGYDKGAFTGAKAHGKPGMFELANGGTLFWDEIAEIPLELQVKLLRAIQEQEILRVGAIKPISLDIRLLAATNQDLKEMVDQQKFREDLYYRINVVPIDIPPLRMRKEDIPFLIKKYVNKFNKKYGSHKVLSSDVIDKLTAYSWPGNVRELINVIERMVVLSETENLTIEDIPTSLQEIADKQQNIENINLLIKQLSDKGLGLKEILCHVECELIKNSLEKCKSTRKAARVLGVDQSTVVRKAQKYMINTESF